ncbi:MAG TPA: SIMPL domain-containing protein [Candidatus Paceibacterota bacterium]|nr:SIMPL domain-containing protein [Candidatus Paceibacterota bacterium]HRZ34191.1 SIMPL domain-containing protein [Candidatus Paceibacterota bacterium]
MNLKKIFENWQYAFGWVVVAVLIVAILLSVYLVSITIDSFDDDFYSSISIAGEGEVVAVPDIATFNFSITEASENVELAQSAASEKTNKALKYLKDNGVEEKDLETSSYNIYPKTRWISEVCSDYYCPGGYEEIIGYEVSQTVTVKVRDTSKAGDLLSGIGSLGISNVSGLSFTSDDRDALEEQAKKLAIEDAQAKAKELAESLGVRLVRVVGFYEDSGSYPMYDYGYEEAGGMGAKSVASPDIPVGEQKITYTVHVDYEIK